MRAFTVTITDDNWEGDIMDAIVDSLEYFGIPALIEEQK
jgi:hypothetical protein